MRLVVILIILTQECWRITINMFCSIPYNILNVHQLMNVNGLYHWLISTFLIILSHFVLVQTFAGQTS